MNICEVCQKSFEKARHLRLHFARNHVDKSKWKSRCEECGKVYADYEILKRHMKNHNKVVSKVACPVEECRKLFVRKSFLDKHVSAIHPHIDLNANSSSDEKSNAPKKLYTCKQEGCGATFTKHNLLTQHSYVHTKILPFQCSHCDKRFMNMGHKNRHEKVHKGYSCRECSLVLSNWTLLLTHTATIHRKKYKCKDCDRIFHTPGRLKIHCTIHADTRDVFQCPECVRNFTRKHALLVHMKVVHSGVRPFKCDAESCDKSYAHRHSLNNHIKKCHNNNNPPQPQKPCSSNKIDVASRILGYNSKTFLKDIG